MKWISIGVSAASRSCPICPNLHKISSLAHGDLKIIHMKSAWGHEEVLCRLRPILNKPQHVFVCLLHITLTHTNLECVNTLNPVKVTFYFVLCYLYLLIGPLKPHQIMQSPHNQRSPDCLHAPGTNNARLNHDPYTKHFDALFCCQNSWTCGL